MRAAANPAALVAATPQIPEVSDSAWRRAALVGTWTVVLLALGALIASIELLILVAAIGGLTAAAVILARPWIGVVLVLFSVPFGSIAQVGMGDFSVSATQPLVALLALGWILRGIRRRDLRVAPSSVLATTVALIGFLLLSVTLAEAKGPAIKEALKWGELLVLLVVTADLARDRGMAMRLLVALLAAGALEALWGGVSAVIGRGPSAFALGGGIRAFGHFDQPNPFAGYLSTIIPIGVALVLFGRGTRLRLFALAATGALGVGVLLSQSRGAWLGLAFSAFILLLLWSRGSRALLAPICAALVFLVVLVGAGFIPGQLFDRLGQTVEYFGIFDVRSVPLTPENWAVVERMAHWQAAWYMFLDHPWLGVGTGNYAEAYPRYYLRGWLEPLGHAHNLYLNQLAEIGVVGLTLFLVFLGTAFKRFVAALKIRGSDVEWRALLLGATGALIVFCTHNLFDNLFVHGVNAQIGFFLGLGLVASDRLRSVGMGHA